MMTEKEALKLLGDICMSVMAQLTEDVQEKVIDARKVLKKLLPEEKDETKDKK